MKLTAKIFTNLNGDEGQDVELHPVSEEVLAERLRDEQAMREDYEIKCMNSVFRRAKGYASRIRVPFELDKWQIWALKWADCFLCGKKPEPVEVNDAGMVFELTDMQVVRIDKKGGFTVENSAAMCMHCRSAVKGKGVYKYIFDLMSADVRNEIGKVHKEQGVEAARQMAIESYRKHLEGQKDENWWE